MALTIDPKSLYVNKTSVFAVKSSAFDQVNYHNTSPANLTITADTPNGILGGMVAKADDVTPANWTADICTNANTATEFPIGFFNLLSEGNPFENNPAAASGKVAIYMGCRAIFNLYYFETHSATSPYAIKDFATVYKVGKPLYVGPYGLVTNISPSVAGNSSNPNIQVATIVKTPTTSDLEMGIVALI